MKQYKLNWRYWFFVILFGGIQPLGYKAVYMLWNNEVTYEDGVTVERAVVVFMCMAISFILLVYLSSVINLLVLYIKNKGCGLTITEKGIENTVVIFKFLALFIIVPVKLIPWEAIKYYNKDNGELYIRVKKRQVEAGLLGKLIISVLGYQFCQGLVKPAVKPEDIEKYEHRFSNKI